jgi:alkanesulfonate monooxygenase SsuD/methylene tetrahydromethanopterin reductase-like flavin-dependent oxidoreductase (luciferase family)
VVQPIGIHSPGYIAETDEQAREELWPSYKAMRDRIGRERGWPPMTRNEFESEIENGSLYVGSPETVAAKLTPVIKTLGISRFQLKYSAGTLSHHKLMHCIELYAKEVIPAVRAGINEGI